jgi:hypothetical protein
MYTFIYFMPQLTPTCRHVWPLPCQVNPDGPWVTEGVEGISGHEAATVQHRQLAVGSCSRKHERVTAGTRMSMADGT